MILLAQLVLLASLDGPPAVQNTPPAPPPAGASPVPSPAPLATASAAPTTLPSAAPPAPSTAPPPTPTPEPTFGYRYVPRPAASPDPTAPQILAVDLNSRQLHDRIAIRVLTNDVVTRVENHTNGRSDIIPHTGPGEFIAVSKLPKIPFIARGMTVVLQFVAYAADGRKASVKVPVELV
jgi:hypothetical protein